MSDHTKPLMKSLISNKFVLGGNILFAPKFWSGSCEVFEWSFPRVLEVELFMTLYDRRLFVSVGRLACLIIS